MSQPLASLEDLIQQSLDPTALRERFGLPHLPSKFAVNGAVREGAYADAIVEFVNDWTLEPPESARCKSRASRRFSSRAQRRGLMRKNQEVTWNAAETVAVADASSGHRN